MHKIALFFLLLFSVGAVAQTTVVSINPVADGDGTVWASGNYTITLVNPPGIGGPPFLVKGTTSLVANQTQAGQLTPSGSASGLSLTDNNFVAPSGTVWQFTICPLATSPCFTTQVKISGPTQAVTIAPPAIRINLAGIPFRVAAYTDAELVGAIYGNFYYNVVEPSLRVCVGNPPDACVWQDVGQGSGIGIASSVPATPIYAAPGNALTPDGCFGDSTGLGDIFGCKSFSLLGVGGVINFPCQTTPANPAASSVSVFCNSATGLFSCLNSSGSLTCFGGISAIASGTATMGTGAITSGGCATAVVATATGTSSTSRLVATPTADPTGISGYGPSASGSLYIQGFPTTNAVNFKVCNNTGGTITPAALTLNWITF